MTDGNDEAKQKVWKLEGEAFEKVKAAKVAYDAARKEAGRIKEEGHKKLWDAIREALPETETEKNLNLDVEYEEAGIYMVKKSTNLFPILAELIGNPKKAADEAA
jgi:hypothetical protein